MITQKMRFEYIFLYSNNQGIPPPKMYILEIAEYYSESQNITRNDVIGYTIF